MFKLSWDKNRGITIAEYYTMQGMLEGLVGKGLITRREIDLTLERIATENNLVDDLYGRRDHRYQQNILANTVTPQPTENKVDGFRSVLPVSNDIITTVQTEQKVLKYISLTEIVRSSHMENPSYVIQSWLRSENTLVFLDLWEQENNPAYDASAYAALLEKKKTSSFTVTAKQWIDRTKAIGIISKQGKQGGTFAHPMIACEFAT